jgi:dimethylhistidine N-methyltransferase
MNVNAADLGAAGSSDLRFREDVLAGLSARKKWLAPKYFYDAAGSRLFDRICELPEYYLTRTELDIMRTNAADMAAMLGPSVLLIEPGSGSSVKVRRLLDHLERPAGYVPVEISEAHMLASVDALRTDYPALEVLPVWADFTQPFAVPRPARAERRRAVYFPGSTLGNFPPVEAVALLRHLRGLVGRGGAVLLGLDLEKDPEVMLPAYDDAEGVTAAFNRNLLVRINRELDGDFVPEAFAHRAVWNAECSRIEMHLVSRGAQRVRVAGCQFEFADGEAVTTEYSHKPAPAAVAALAAGAGFRIERCWTDTRGWFGVYCLSA